MWVRHQQLGSAVGTFEVSMQHEDSKPQITELLVLRNHITQDEATPLIFEESDDASVCTKDCEYYQKERHLHCRMVGTVDQC